METTTILIYAEYFVVFLAVLARLLASNGWEWKPAFYPDGKFQLNSILIIITGFLAAIPILDTVDVTGLDPVMTFAALFTIFMSVYGTPAVIDKVVSAVTPATEDEGA